MTTTQQSAADYLAQISRKNTKQPRILFFDREAFADNSKYLYLHMLKHYPQFEIIWCSYTPGVINDLKRAGLPYHDINHATPETLSLMLEAAIAIFCVNPWQSLGAQPIYAACLEGAKHVQLWHGVSVKHLQLSLISHLDMSEAGHILPMSWATRADYVLSTAPYFDAFWAKTFGCQQLLRGAFPRNEVITRTPMPEEMTGAMLPPAAQQAMQQPGRKIFLAPTWQRNKATSLTSSSFMLKLMRYALHHNINVFVKTHPYHKGDNVFASGKVANLHSLPMELDIYPWLNHFDVLITDYSSIMFDYLLTGKPVLTLDIPAGKHHNFEPDYRLVPGNDNWRYRFTPDNLVEVLHSALHQDDKQFARQEMLAQIFACDSSQANADLAYKVVKMLEERCQSPQLQVF